MKVISKAEAFEVRRGEVSIPLKQQHIDHKYQFTRRWFPKRNQVTWSTYLRPMFKRNIPYRAIQIGVFEFYDAAWLMQNVLTHEKSFLVGIDPWLATTKLSQEYMDGVYERAKHNSSPWGNRATLIRDKSENVLPKLGKNGYDLVVIDGDHNAPAVTQDAIQALRLLKPGGVMVFDDVRNRIPKKNHVLDGIRDFLAIHEDAVKLAWQHRFADAYIKR